MGLRTGDRVKVASKTGSVVVPVRLTQGASPPSRRPDRRASGTWEMGKIARGKKAKSSDFDTDLLWWEEDGNGVNSNAVVSSDP